MKYLYFPLLLVGTVVLLFFSKGTYVKQSHNRRSNQVLRNKKIPELMLFEQT